MSYSIIKPWWIFFFTSNTFAGVKIVKNTKYCFIEKTDTIIRNSTLKWIILVKKCNSTFFHIYISFFVVPNQNLHVQGFSVLRLSFAQTISWRQFRCKKGCTPLSSTKLAFFVKNWWTYKDEVGKNGHVNVVNDLS